jgi:hypothetical protein
VKGLTFDTSTTNAVLNAFGVIYFLTKKNVLMLLICMVILLFTGSNFVNIILLLILALLFFLRTDRNQKSLIAICLLFLAVFMAKISPQNNNYVVETFKNLLHPNKIHKQVIAVNPIPIALKPDSLLSPEERKQKVATLFIDSVHKATENKKTESIAFKNIQVNATGKILEPKPDINSAPYQHLKTTPPAQSQLADFVKENKAFLPVSGKSPVRLAMPGKITSMLQTLNFLNNNPTKIITGDGMGNFSSKLAFKASGLGLTGGYPAKYHYINHDFLVNHLDLYLNFFSKGADLHSLTNSPFSVYDQLFAEYGVLGITIFFIFYLGFFLKNRNTLTYGLPIILLITAVLFIDYWFEQLSVLVFFELLILLDIKESSGKKILSYGH